MVEAAGEGGETYRFDGKPGALVVDSIDRVPVGKITAREVRRAGSETAADLRAALRTGGASVTARTAVYRIAFHFERAAATRPPAVRTAADLDALVARLDRMDRLGRRGPWTRRVLALIAKHPRRRAGDLAPLLDRDLRAFKADVRKLKGPGLTTSFEVGYELTPLGRRVLEHR
ncbi:MAG: hypothetical protein ACYTG1_01090 [Planctomycetota bacterium]|jgi:hypothetical protein